MSDAVSLVLVNGPPGSVQSPRALALFGEGTPVVYKERGRIGSVRAIGDALRAVKSGWIYCIDLGLPAAPLAALHRARNRGVRLAFELGDAGRPLIAGGGGHPAKAAAAHWLDRNLPPRADKLVFRGSYLADYFGSIAAKPLPPSAWIPDGVDVDAFRPARSSTEVATLRARHGLQGRFVVGLVGSLHHNPVHNLFYGWELAESLAKIPADAAITGVVVGDGPGRAVLEATRDRLGLGDRLRLIGRVPHAEVATWMNVFDLGLSTQTDDPVGWGRTTAKLPEYLACGLPLACTDVGEAHRWLSGTGQALPYSGMRDETYPERLAAHIVAASGRDLEPTRVANRSLALRLFDYRLLRDRLTDFLADRPHREPSPEPLA